MAGLHIVVGSKTRNGPHFEVLYAGTSASEARAAEGKSKLPWFTRIDNPVTVIKHNSRAAQVSTDVSEGVDKLNLNAEQSGDASSGEAPTDAPRGRRKN
jgi:hypothetical protein